MGKSPQLVFSLACCFYVRLLDNHTSLPSCNHLLPCALSDLVCLPVPTITFLTALQIPRSHKLQSLHLTVTSLIHLCQWHNLDHPLLPAKGLSQCPKEQTFYWAFFLPNYQVRTKMSKWWFSVSHFLASAVFQHPSCL